MSANGVEVAPNPRRLLSILRREARALPKDLTSPLRVEAHQILTQTIGELHGRNGRLRQLYFQDRVAYGEELRVIYSQYSMRLVDEGGRY